MTPHPPRHSRDERPDFMIRLGLAPPYLREDVDQAYREHAKKAHPDRGGSVEEFRALQEAFDRARDYVDHHVDRRGWIAAKVERYTALERAVARLEVLGATVTTSARPWLQQSFGDFAQIAETAFLLRALGLENGDEIVAAMLDEHAALRELEIVELPGCRLSDRAVLCLAEFQQLQHLNLSYTPITKRALAVVDELPLLKSIDLEGTSVGWWARRRVQATLRRRGAV